VSLYVRRCAAFVAAFCTLFHIQWIVLSAHARCVFGAWDENDGAREKSLMLAAAFLTSNLAEFVERVRSDTQHIGGRTPCEEWILHRVCLCSDANATQLAANTRVQVIEMTDTAESERRNKSARPFCGEWS
jgi:hypothetical protein